MLVNKYIDEIEKVYHYSKITFLFRGQSHHDWGLVSSAHRRIQDKSTESFKNYIQDLIEQTIELQHFGASTYLVDFTTKLSYFLSKYFKNFYHILILFVYL